MCKLILINPIGTEGQTFSVFAQNIRQHFVQEPHFQIALIDSGDSELKEYKNQLLLQLTNFEKNGCFVHKPISIDPFIAKIQQAFHGEISYSYALGLVHYTETEIDKIVDFYSGIQFEKKNLSGIKSYVFNFKTLCAKENIVEEEP